MTNKKRSPITTHVLDISRGKPAVGISVLLEMQISKSKWKILKRAATDADGRAVSLMKVGSRLKTGVYRLTFETAKYFKALGAERFYPLVTISFEVKETTHHYHVPLLLSPYGYSTYRGS